MISSSESVRRTLTKTLSVILCAVFLLALAATALTGCEKEEEKGEDKPEEVSRAISLIEFDGTVSIERAGKTLDAKRDMALESGDVIEPGEGASARIRIDDDKFLYLDASTRVQLTAEGTADVSHTMVYVEKGSVLTEVKRKLSDESSFNVVTPNTSMAIHGTKTLTEVIKDVVSETVRANNAVIEGKVKVKAVKVKADGTVVSVERDLGAGEGNSFSSTKEELVAIDEMISIAGTGASVSGITVEIVTEEEADVKFDMATFNATFLETIKNILIADAEEEASEEGLSQEAIEAINSQIDEIMNTLDMIRENSQNAINKAQENATENSDSDKPGTASVTKPTPSPVPEPTPEPAPAPVPVIEPDWADNDTNTVNMDDTLTQIHVHSYSNRAAKAATCTEAGWKAYKICTECGDNNYVAIAALGHNFGKWTVATEPYPVYDGEFLSTWHAGTKVKKCSRCTAKQEEPILVVPELKNEVLGVIDTLPIDFFSDFGLNPIRADATLEEFGTDDFWASSPQVPDDPAATVDLTGAVLEWESGSTAISSLKEGDTVKMKITVPADLKGIYENTVVSITLTGVHEHVWGEEGYIDEEHPLARCCELCGEIMAEYEFLN